MTDPFDALYLPLRPVEPDAGFAERLRERLERTILLGEDMSTTGAVQTEYSTVTPYLAFQDSMAAIEFYVDVFGAQRRGEPVMMPDGSVGHAEIAIGGSVLMLADEWPEYDHVAPTGTGVRPMHHVQVDDVDLVVERARERGAEVLRPAVDTGHGYSSTILDPFGYRWMVAARTSRAQGVSPQSTERVPHGHVGYYTLTVPDDEAAKRFYGAVLGWTFTRGRVEHGWGIEGAGLPMSGLWGGQARAGWKLMYAVDDLEAALARVREHGGTTREPEQQAYGLAAECTDDQGIEFWLWQQ
ncbi:VOC family protein [Saccharothrix sp.]|uniref:VOC family protein n=1 Tax=Saccharothrix sp. TaxID=1873460 RepID=UPI002811B83D|nr:VOC family protein [Saccharothrix sp.]